MIIKPGNSCVFVRLFIALNVISVVLIVHASIAWFIQFIMLILLLFYFIEQYKIKKPYAELYELRLMPNYCELMMLNGQIHRYEKLTILICNDFFQLLQFTNENQNKRMVLFNDQISLNELRLLHVQARINYSNKLC